MKKLYTIVVLGVFTVLFLAIFYFFPKNTIQAPVVNDVNESGISVSYPKPNDVIWSPLKIAGLVNGSGWIGFEGQVGTARLFDAKEKEIAIGILTAQGEWMQKIINFESTLIFAPVSPVPGKLVFYNENPSGEPVRDKIFIVPVTFK